MEVKQKEEKYLVIKLMDIEMSMKKNHTLRRSGT